MDSKHWDWGKGYCRKHPGNGVPCPVCIKMDDPDLVRTREEVAKLLGKSPAWISEFVEENPCKEINGEVERNREEWAAYVEAISVPTGQVPLADAAQPRGEYFDWKSVRPIGDTIKGHWQSNQPGMQNIPKRDVEKMAEGFPPSQQSLQLKGLTAGKFDITGETKVKGIFVPNDPFEPEAWSDALHDVLLRHDNPVIGKFTAELKDADGNVIYRKEGENRVVSKGVNSIANIDIQAGSRSNTFYYPGPEDAEMVMAKMEEAHRQRMEVDMNVAGQILKKFEAGDAKAVYPFKFPNIITKEMLEEEEQRAEAERRAAWTGEPVLYSSRSIDLAGGANLQNGDSLLVSYTISADSPEVDVRMKHLPLQERLALVAEQHRQKFVAAGVKEPEELLKMLGTAELIQPKIEGFELPTKLPRRLPIDFDLINTVVEAEEYSDELRASLMAQIKIYGAPIICGLLAQYGVDEKFIDSLTSNLSEK